VSASAAGVALQRALEISRELANIADSGDVQLTQPLDAERLQLLKLARGASRRLDDTDRKLLQEIAELNDKAIGFLEHRRRLKARDMDMVSVGRRAVRAYSATRLHR
jgi:hypothetical protein